MLIKKQVEKRKHYLLVRDIQAQMHNLQVRLQFFYQEANKNVKLLLIMKNTIIIYICFFLSPNF